MKTKYISQFALLFTISIVFYSCEPNFLDEHVSSFIEKGNFYQTDADYQSALIGVYDMLGSSTPLTTDARGLPLFMGNYGYGHMIIGDCGTDLFWLTTTGFKGYPGAPGSEYALETYNTTTNYASGIGLWANNYIGIDRANNLIVKVTDADSIKSKRNQYKAEAKFLRALYYYDLVTVLGGVPVVLQPTPAGTYLQPTRASVDSVFKVIINDLVTALPHLVDVPAANGYVSKNAARGLLARVYLYLASMKQLANLPEDAKLGKINSFDFVDAKEYYRLAAESALQVIATYPSANPFTDATSSTGLTQYASSFYPIEKSPDLIFDIQFSSNFPQLEGSYVYKAFGPVGSSVLGGGVNYLRPMFNNHYETYDVADARFTLNICTYQLVSVNGVTTFKQATTATNIKSWMTFGKYRIAINPTNTINNNPQNIPVIRLAEICLIYSEANAEYGVLNNGTIPSDAYKYLNYVRQRSRTTPTALPDITQTNLNNSTIVKPLVVGQNIIPGGVTGDIGNFRIAILNERKWELSGEGFRRIDLLRMGVLQNIVTALNTSETETTGASAILYPRSIQPKDCFKPIPQREIELSRETLVQNWGF